MESKRETKESEPVDSAYFQVLCNARSCKELKALDERLTTQSEGSMIRGQTLLPRATRDSH